MTKFYFISLIDTFFYFYMMLLVVRILSSWFQELQSSKAIEIIRIITDPYLDLFRRIIPPIGMIDISPIIAFFALQFIEALLKGFVLAL
jgi:YggT family protein